MISALVLTLNEEKNISRCISALKWCDEIFVLDSYSTDKTVQIAESLGARIFYRHFDNERSQREYSVGLPFKNDWIFNPDADEIPDAELIEEILQSVSGAADSIHAFRMRFKVVFLGKWIKNSSLYPTWSCRLFRRTKISFSRSVNLQYNFPGQVVRLNGHFWHFTFNNGLHAWFEKHNRYSTFEANETLLYEFNVRDILSVLSFDPVRRRYGVKCISQLMPLRFIMRFFYMYLFRLGILDGIAGLYYCAMISYYELMIEVKIRERRLMDKMG